MRDAPSSFVPRVRVGNDVVDLRHPRCVSRPSPDRLPDRVLTASEASWYRTPAAREARNRRLWSLWAGKETAFKVVTKVLGSPPVFRHRAFEMELEEREEGGGFFRVEGVGRWSSERAQGWDIAIRLEGLASSGFVHLVGWGPHVAGQARPTLEVGVEGWGGGAEDAAEERAVTEEESRGVHGPLSRRARKLARSRLAGHLRVYRGEGGAGTESGVGGESGAGGDPRIEILTSGKRPGRTPPRIVIDGTHRPELDLSLSHHGRYVGWALLLPPGAGRVGEPGSIAGLV